MNAGEMIMTAASVFSAACVLGGAIIAVYKVYRNNQRQNEVIEKMQQEQTIICYGLKGALQGLIEQGCDGPCKDALAMLDKHLNKTAHMTEL